MYIILIAWGFVVILMTAAEIQSSTLLGGMLTLVLYGVLPMAILLYIMRTPVRRKMRAREEAAEMAANQAAKQEDRQEAGSGETEIKG